MLQSGDISWYPARERGEHYLAPCRQKPTAALPHRPMGTGISSTQKLLKGEGVDMVVIPCADAAREAADRLYPRSRPEFNELQEPRPSGSCLAAAAVLVMGIVAAQKTDQEMDPDVDQE